MPVLSYATWTPLAGTQETRPISCVNWWESCAFCIWDGGFLPSEAEWEYAAAGGTQEREYPWGTAAPGTANQYGIYDCYYPTEPSYCSLASIAPVGTATLGAGLWGQLDLSGELEEWNLDWYVPYVDPCIDCASLTPAAYRAMRGGSFWLSPANGAPPVRGRNAPAFRGNYTGFGFRCARSP
jgi:formylglycine-generating enzyme required for sulfatase activity